MRRRLSIGAVRWAVHEAVLHSISLRMCAGSGEKNVASGRVARSVRCGPSRIVIVPPGAISEKTCPSASAVTQTSGVSFVTTTSLPRGMTSGRAWRECGATKVTAIASRPQTSTGPPFERL